MNNNVVNDEQDLNNSNNNENENSQIGNENSQIGNENNENQNLQNENTQPENLTNDNSQPNNENVQNENSQPVDENQPVENVEPVTQENGTAEDESYKVIFTYDNFNYYLRGGDSVSLSTLLTQLNINVNINEISSVESSDPSKVSTSSNGSDYTISSLIAFDTEERLTVELEDGTKYVIKIMDPVGDIPEHHKDLTPNPAYDDNGQIIYLYDEEGNPVLDENGNPVYQGNGSYNLSLTVKGDSEKQITKVNVVVVLDTSNSMQYTYSGDNPNENPITTDSYYYTPSNGNEQNMYGVVDGQFVPLTRNGNNNYSYNGERYTDQRYTRQGGRQRIHAAKGAGVVAATGGHLQQQRIRLKRGPESSSSVVHNFSLSYI